MTADRSKAFSVLYVEDAIDQALLVKAFFNTMAGYTVTHAQDGQKAIQLIEQKPWDLLVTDLNLPGADGFSVIKAFRTRYPRDPILVTTGYTQAEYEEPARSRRWIPSPTGCRPAIMKASSSRAGMLRITCGVILPWCSWSRTSSSAENWWPPSAMQAGCWPRPES